MVEKATLLYEKVRVKFGSAIVMGWGAVSLNFLETKDSVRLKKWCILIWRFFTINSHLLKPVLS